MATLIGPITFRLDPRQASGASGNGALSQRRGGINVTLWSAPVATVAEPATISLILIDMAGLGFSVWRRRRLARQRMR